VETVAKPTSSGTALAPSKPAKRQGDALPLLAEAKLAPPRKRRTLIARPRLLDALDAGRGAGLTLVAAPPGYGKTTAVRAWCASRDIACAWVTLDASDNDPVRLWTYVATAVDRVRGGLGRGALQRLRHAGAPIDAAVDEVMNGVAAFRQEIVIVLDDLQAVTNAECLATLDQALDVLPGNARVIAVSRTDPPFRLPHLRARGDLVEIRAGDLAFTAGETCELLIERMGVGIDPEDVGTLLERTEGWPAAVFLAGLWLGSVDDPDAALREFGGDHRFVVDYLTSEVIGALDDDDRAFVLRASVLGRFTPELCDHVLRRDDSKMALARLEQANPFIARLAHANWYRVHPLFAEFARHQLAAQDPGAVTEAHRRAARWLRKRGSVVEAAHHAVAARDHELLARLLEEHHLEMLWNGAARTLLTLVEALPDATLAAHPEVAAAGASAAFMLGQRTLEYRRLLHLADRAREERPQCFTPCVEAAVLAIRAAGADEGVECAVADGRRAAEIAAADADEVLVAALGAQARSLFLAGRLDGAWQAGLRAIEHPDAERRAPGQAFARSTLALVAAERGLPDVARRHAQRARELMGGVGSSRSWLGANAAVAMGCILAGEGHVAEAERELVHAEHFFRDEVATVHHAWLLVLLARLRVGRGRLEQAEQTLQAARDALAQLGDAGRVVALASAVEAELSRANERIAASGDYELPSAAEMAVLRLLGSDLTIREIAGELVVSPNTVRSHTRSIYRKFRVNSRADAVARAGSLGL
jgi:LuxR family maltose regulon positive regulatory protein